MEREFKSKKQNEVSEVTTAYEAALKEEWEAMASFYDKNPLLIFHHLTVDEDTAFHIAAYSGNTALLQFLLDLVPDDRVEEVFSKKNTSGNTLFHEVATTSKLQAAELLIRKLQGWQDRVGGNYMVQLKELLKRTNKLGETPLYRAVAVGQLKMAKFLAKRVGDIREHFHRKDRMSILHIAVIGQHFETAAWLLEQDETLAQEKEESGMTCLHLLALMPSAFWSSVSMGPMKSLLYHCLPNHHYDDDDDDDCNGDEAQKLSSQMEDLEIGQGSSSLRQSNKQSSAISRTYCAMWRSMAKGWPTVVKIWKIKKRHMAALALTRMLVIKDTTWIDSCSADTKTISLGRADSLTEETKGKGEEGAQSNTSKDGIGGDVTRGRRFKEKRSLYTPMLIAASKGILEIVHSILDVHPQAIEHLTKEEENILHVAIRNRQREIFRHIKKMKTIMECRLVARINNSGYTILHQVAEKENYDGGNRAGPAFQLQEELKWFERVQKIMPSHYVLHKNNADLTAEDLFKQEHADLLKKAQKWTKETSQSCSAVAVLVATVVFASAYTVPGGNDSNGFSVFLHSPFFLFFTVMDVVSLASSLTSVVMFLSILTSPFEQDDFLVSLPRKLMIGFALLFFSVATTMLSFMATILLIIRLEKKSWTTTLIYTAALFPITVLVPMQFPLYYSLTTLLKSLCKRIKRKVPLSFKNLPQDLLSKKQ